MRRVHCSLQVPLIPKYSLLVPSIDVYVAEQLRTFDRSLNYFKSKFRYKGGSNRMVLGVNRQLCSRGYKETLVRDYIIFLLLLIKRKRKVGLGWSRRCE